MRKSSPWLRFACFLTISLLIFVGTWFAQKAETPPWRQQVGKEPAPAVKGNFSTSKTSGTNLQATSFRFVSYNLKNWLSSSQSPEKSPKSKQAIIDILASSQADIIGLSEIGGENDLAEVQRLLKQSGNDYPHRHHTGGIDPVRHLGILSRFPILSASKPDITFANNLGSMQRGILDVTIQAGEDSTRFIGIHLKSKRLVPNYDQAELRIQEAQHVRTHIDSILKRNPETRLVVYGDFNDHIESLSTRIILGKHGDPSYLAPVLLSDKNGDKWTHYYQSQDSYSRIDFIAVSKSLRPSIDQKASRIIDSADWKIASDHRAILTSFR